MKPSLVRIPHFITETFLNMYPPRMVRRRDEDEDYAPSGESSADEEMSSAVESCDDEDPSDEEEEEQPVASSSRQPRHAPVNRQTVSRSALKSALGNAFVFPGSQSQDALESDGMFLMPKKQPNTKL